MKDYLALARRAPTAKLRARYLSLHRAQKLRVSIKDCHNCLLYRTRKHAVPWVGPINGQADLVLVGEAPGATEDKYGEPFVGRAGSLLDRCLETAGTTRRNVAILNTLCCRPPNNRDPEPSEMEACAPNFEAQLSVIGVGFGMALGGYAAAAVLGEPRDSLRMKDIRGTVAYRHGMVWSFTYHPAYILRNMGMAGVFTADLRLAVDIATGERDYDLPFTYLAPTDIDPSFGPGVHDHLRRKGWATVNLRRIGVTVTVVKDERGRYRVPAKAGDYPIYTITELLRLGLISRQHQVSPATLRSIHEAKVTLGGVIVA